MSTNTTMEALKAAGERALAGNSPHDTFAGYGLTLPDAATWCAAWVLQLKEHARLLGEDPDSEEFTFRIAVGCLAAGIEYGRGQARASEAAAGPRA